MRKSIFEAHELSILNLGRFQPEMFCESVLTSFFGLFFQNIPFALKILHSHLIKFVKSKMR